MYDTIKPEIQERLALGPDEGEDFKLVTVRSGADGAAPQSVAKHWVKKNLGVKYDDILSVEYAGWSEVGTHRVFLVTWRIEP